MNNNTRSVNAVAPQSAFPPIMQRDTKPEAEPYSANASYPVESPSIAPLSSYYNKLFNEFIQFPDEDGHGVSMLATSHVDGVLTVNNDSTGGDLLPTDARSADDGSSLDSGEPDLARIFSPSGRVSAAEIEKLDFTPYSETIPGWQPIDIDVSFNGFTATLEADSSTLPQDHQPSNIHTQPPARSALPPALNMAHTRATTPIATRTLLAAPSPPTYPNNLSGKAGTLAVLRPSTSGSRPPKKERKLPGSSAFISTPLKQSWTPEGKILPLIGNHSTRESGPIPQLTSRAYAREAHTATKDGLARAVVCTPNLAATNTRQGVPGPVEASTAAQPTVSSQADPIYFQNHTRLNPAAPAQQSQSYPQSHIDRRVNSPAQTTSTTQVNRRVQADFIVESGGPTAALTRRSIPAPPTLPSAPVQHIQLHGPIPTRPSRSTRASGPNRPTTPIERNMRASSTAQAPNRRTFQARETATPVQPASPGYILNDPPKTGRAVPGRVVGDLFIEMQGNEPVLVYPAAGLTALAGSSAPDVYIQCKPGPHSEIPSHSSRKRRAPWGADDSSRDKRARHGGN